MSNKNYSKIVWLVFIVLEIF